MLKNVAGQRVSFSLFKSGARIANPTIAVVDFKVDIDGAGQANVTTPPTSDAAGLVTWLPSQAETNGDIVTLLGNDAAGSEWEPLIIVFETQMPTSVEAILATIGVAGAGLTNLGDTRLANLDETVSSRGTADPGDQMGLADDAITASKFDETTAFPVKLADTGSTKIARTGADSDTLETLSDQLDDTPTLGAGAIEWTYTLTSSVDGTAIGQADVWVTTDSAGTNVVASGTTSDLGVVTFYLDSGLYYVWRSKSGWTFTNPDSETVS